MPPPVWTNQQIIDNFERWNSPWILDTIGYVFLQSSTAEGFTPFTVNQMAASQLAFQLFGDIININFVQVADNNDYYGEITLENTVMSDAYWGLGGGGWTSGGLQINVDYSGGTYAPGTYDFTALMHEIGHALNLPHPGEYNASPDGDPITYATHADYQQDSRQYTLMSYFDAFNTGASHGGYYGSTPLLHDVLALQAMYGANMTTRTGDTVYGFNSNAGRAPLDFVANAHPIIAIWDAGGTDTIDLSGYFVSCTLDLNAGAFSDVAGMTDNLAICYNAIIENGIGGNAADTLIGNGVANILNGGAGADSMRGGGGNDTYIVDNTGDTVTENAGAGTDTVQSSVTFTLTANIENLTLTGAGAVTAYGNVLANTITGNGANNALYGFDGADILNGGAGADNMFGGNGDDTYYVDNAGDQTTEGSALGGTDIVFSSVTRNLTANIENLTLTGTGAITGSGNALNNIITGNTGANTLYGFDGNDRLDGGTGADSMFGANGNDTYVVDNVNDITVEGSPSGGIDTVESSINRNLNANFENLILTGTAQYGYGNVLANTLIGNASANGLYGLDGNDYLDGGTGADQMFGGNGNDTYIVDNAGDVTSEVSPSGGVDTVISSVTRNLTANLENLELSGSANITGAGNALNNEITGNSGANTLYGLDGADILDGGLGADTLQGGTGADQYVFSSTLGGGNIDTIVGFSVVDDSIVLSAGVFTALGPSGTPIAAGAFFIGAAAADASDRIIYNSATGALYYDADGNGAGAAIQFATLAPGLALTNNDFIIGPS